MRLSIFFIAAMLMALSATIAFGEDGQMPLYNPTSSIRVVKLHVSVPTGASASPTATLPANGGEDCFDVQIQQPLTLDEDWHIRILNSSGTEICDGHFTRTSKGFTPGTLGGCFTYKMYDEDVVVKITK